MASDAAQKVKLGFWIAVGFWFFGITMMILCFFIIRAYRS